MATNWTRNKSELAQAGVELVRSGQQLPAVAKDLTAKHYTGSDPYLTAQKLELDILTAWRESLTNGR